MARLPNINSQYIYFLISFGEIVYIGQTTNYLGRMTHHRQTKTFDEIEVIDLCGLSADDCEFSLIYKLQPIYNRSIPKPSFAVERSEAESNGLNEDDAYRFRGKGPLIFPSDKFMMRYESIECYCNEVCKNLIKRNCNGDSKAQLRLECLINGLPKKD